MLETGLIEHCAPTLAGLKTAGLFNYRCADEKWVREEIACWNSRLNSKGVSIERLICREDFSLIYVYRAMALQRDLQKSGVPELLRHYEYEICHPVAESEQLSVKSYLDHLKRRFMESDRFPHEIGVFFGYPVEDVTGFIMHQGKECKCCGLWKVYCNECETVKLFEKLNRCTRIYSQVFAAGRSIEQMTVPA